MESSHRTKTLAANQATFQHPCHLRHGTPWNAMENQQVFHDGIPIDRSQFRFGKPCLKKKGSSASRCYPIVLVVVLFDLRVLLVLLNQQSENDAIDDLFLKTNLATRRTIPSRTTTNLFHDLVSILTRER